MTEEEKAKAEAEAKAKADAEAKAKADADKKKKDDDDDDEDDKKFSSSYVEKLRKENAAARAEAKALKEAQEAREAEEAKKNGEFEKLAKQAQAKAEAAEKRIAEMEANTRARLFKTELRAAAVAAGIDDIDDVALINIGDISTLDDDDLERHASKLVKEFKAAKPKKFSSQKDADDDDKNVDKPSNKRVAPKTTPTPNNDVKTKPKNAKEMTSAEFADAWARA